MNNETQPTTIAGPRGVLIADEMGLGKTIQAIGVINYATDIERVLIVCPASLKLNWAKEIKKWRTRPIAVHIVNGSNSIPQDGIVIINYDLLSRHAAALNAREFDLVVLDEAHYTKNPDAKRTKIAHAIPAKRRLYLTGTPILNKPKELYPLLSALDPERWHKKTFMKFAFRYCDAKQVSAGRKMVWDFNGASHLDELQKMLRESVMVRRLKKDVLRELPPKRRAIVELEGNDSIRAIAAREMAKWEEQRALIEGLRDSAELAELLDDKAAYEEAVLALRNAATAAFTEMSAVRHECAIAKAPLCIKFIIEQLEGSDGKLVIFAHHRDVLELAQAELAQYNPVLLYGGMSPESKQASVDRFQSDPSCRVFLGGIHAAGVGLTLTASSHEIFMELDWTPAVVSQAEDRCHRIGQTDSVLVQHLVIEDSLDAKMAKMIIDKQRIADAALDNRPNVAPTLAPQPATTTVTVFDPGSSANAAEGATAEKTFTAEQAAAAHQAMRILAGVCDGAFALDDRGFNKFDSPFGKALAAHPALSPKQTAVAIRLAIKYQRQLPADLVAVAKGAGK